MRATDEKGPELQYPDRDRAVVGSLERGFPSDVGVQQFLLEGVRGLPRISHT